MEKTLEKIRQLNIEIKKNSQLLEEICKEEYTPMSKMIIDNLVIENSLKTEQRDKLLEEYEEENSKYKENPGGQVAG